jgi:hypothetical protein
VIILFSETNVKSGSLVVLIFSKEASFLSVLEDNKEIIHEKCFAPLTPESINKRAATGFLF